MQGKVGAGRLPCGGGLPLQPQRQQGTLPGVGVEPLSARRDGGKTRFQVAHQGLPRGVPHQPQGLRAPQQHGVAVGLVPEHLQCGARTIAAQQLVGIGQRGVAVGGIGQAAAVGRVGSVIAPCALFALGQQRPDPGPLGGIPRHLLPQRGEAIACGIMLALQ